MAPRGAYAGMLALALGAALPAHAQTPHEESIQIGLSTDKIAITAGFSGADLTIFGALEDADPLIARQGRYDVVVVPGGGKEPRPVWTPPLSQHRPPPGPDGRTQFHLDRAEDGTLRVRRSTLPPAAVLIALATERDAVRLTLDGADGSLAALSDDATLATWPVVDGAATLTLEHLDGVPAQVLRLMAGTDGAWQPIRRRGNAIADPGRTVPLPQLYQEEAEEPRARLRWGPQGNLLLRLLSAPGEAGH